MTDERSERRHDAPRDYARNMITTLLHLAVMAAPSSGQPDLSSPTQGTREQLRALVGHDGGLIETEHFTIGYTTDEQTVAPLAKRLECTYQAVRTFCESIGLDLRDPHTKLPVLFFERPQAYQAYREKCALPDDATYGGYLPSNNIAAFTDTRRHPAIEALGERIQIAMRAAGVDDAEERIAEIQAKREALIETLNRWLVQHEAAHQVLYNIGVHVRGAHNPPWLTEGLACLFETPQICSPDWRPVVNGPRLADLRKALGVAPGTPNDSQADYQRALSAGRLKPLAELVGAPAFAVDEHRAFVYAQAWSLVYYLAVKRPADLAAIIQRCRLRRAAGETDERDSVDAFESVCGKLDQDFESQWLSFVLQLPYDREAVRPPERN